MVALTLAARTAAAQDGFSVVAGAAFPVADLAKTAGAGLDIGFQVRTEPILGPLPLRIDVAYDFLKGKGGLPNEQIATGAVNVTSDFGSAFYWAAGPGYFQSTVKTEIVGHTASEQHGYLGVQGVLGIDFPLLRWKGFVEAGITKLFSPGPSIMYIPARLGVRL